MSLASLSRKPPAQIFKSWLLEAPQPCHFLVPHLHVLSADSDLSSGLCFGLTPFAFLRLVGMFVTVKHNDSEQADIWQVGSCTVAPSVRSLKRSHSRGNSCCLILCGPLSPAPTTQQSSS